MKKKMSRFVSSLKSCDRRTLIALCTAAVFLLLGVTQLFTVILAPAARTFDRFALLLVDFLIAAACVLYMLVQSGKLSDLPDKLRGAAGKITHAPKKSPAAKEEVPASRRRNTSDSPGSTSPRENAAVADRNGRNAPSSPAPSRQPTRSGSQHTGSR